MAEYNENKEQLSVSQLVTPQDHIAKIKSLTKARWEHEREWKLNHAFYTGNQYAFFPKRSSNMVTLATEPAELPRYRVRLISNQIMPGVRSYTSKLTKTKPVIHAVPSVATEKASRGAQIAERLEEHWWRSLNLEAKRNEAWTWSCIGGQGWWKIGWDFNSGKTINYTLGPDGLPIISDKIASLFRETMEEQGAEAIEATVSLGEVRVDVLSPHDVILDPSPTDYTECNYAYCVHRLDPDEVYNRYKVRLAPDTRGVDLDSPTIPYTKDDNQEKDLVTIYVGYFRKTPSMPNGKYVVFAAGHEKFLYEGDWPYPFDELPLVKFPGLQIPGSVYDRAIATDSRPLQLELNRTISQIVEYKNLNIVPQFIAPANSMMRNRITGEPGAIWFYNPTAIGGAGKPEPVNLGQLPSYVFDHVQNIIVRIREIFQMTGVGEGNIQGIPNLEAGVAIDLLQELSIDQMEPQIHQGEQALARAGTMMLAFAQEYYDEPRIAKLMGGRIMAAESFTKSDIKDIDIYIEAGSGIPRTRAGRMFRIKSMTDAGLIRPDTAWKYYDMADMKTIAARFALDEEKAYRENDLILRGSPINAIAGQSAMQAVQQGINPSTQQSIQSPEEAQGIVMDAMLEPGPADNHFVEMEIHAIAIKSEEFQSYPMEIQRAYYTHFIKHQQMAQASSAETQPPRVSYQIRGTAGASASAEILKKSGVDVSVEQMAEPPLETWVSDSIDKPDMDEAGNDPFTEVDLALAQSKLQEQRARTELMEKRARTAKITAKTDET